MNELLSRFDTWLATNLSDYYASLQPGITDAELDAFEAKLGHKLTDDFRSLYKWRNGSHEQVNQNESHPIDSMGGTPFVAAGSPVPPLQPAGLFGETTR